MYSYRVAVGGMGVGPEELASSGQLANMLEESKRRVPMGFHTYLKSAHEDPTKEMRNLLHAWRHACRLWARVMSH